MNTQTLIQLLPLVAVFAIMYLLLIRPQKKKEKQINFMRNGVKVGDEILTIGGIYGKVTKVKDDRLTIEVGSDKTRFEVTRWSVSNVINAAPGKKDSKPDAPTPDVLPEETQTASEDEAGKKKRSVQKKSLRKEEPPQEPEQEQQEQPEEQQQ